MGFGFGFGFGFVFGLGFGFGFIHFCRSETIYYIFVRTRLRRNQIDMKYTL